MRKNWAIILCAILTCVVMAAIAESSFFSQPLADSSLDELVEMRDQINIEILTRFARVEGAVLEPGMYIVGEDIPEGNYYFEGVEGRYTTSVHVYPSIDNKGSYSDQQEVSGIGYGDFASAPKSGKFILRNGNAVKIVQGPAVIHVYQGLMN